MDQRVLDYGHISYTYVDTFFLCINKPRKTMNQYNAFLSYDSNGPPTPGFYRGLEMQALSHHGIRS
jgi:hypothetical protein